MDSASAVSSFSVAGEGLGFFALAVAFFAASCSAFSTVFLAISSALCKNSALFSMNAAYVASSFSARLSVIGCPVRVGTLVRTADLSNSFCIAA